MRHFHHNHTNLEGLKNGLFSATLTRLKDQSKRETPVVKIAISGAGNCGKTTLAKHLSKVIGMPIVEEGLIEIRNIIRHKPINFTVLANNFATVQRKKKIAEKHNKNGFIADRCSIDLFQHWILYPGLRQHPDTLDFFNKCKRQTQRYDFVIFPPWGVATYGDLANFNLEKARTNINPWQNIAMHSSLLGLAHLWLPAEKILQIPDDIVDVSEWSAWLVERIS